jgi:hypothetical protein
MRGKKLAAASLAVLMGTGFGLGAAQADDMWDMMNPAWWMGLDDDDDDDDWKYWYYGPGRYAWGGPYGNRGYGGYAAPYPGYGYGQGYPMKQQQSKKKAAPAPRIPE